MMKILGLMMVRNGETHVSRTLGSMSVYCDNICAINDRSNDGTLRILNAFPKVTNIFSVDSSVSEIEWFFSESLMLELLYRMADFYLPDWIILVDSDEIVEPATQIRDFLKSTSNDVVAIKSPRVSIWNDPIYPYMIPLMGSGRSMQGNIWRYFPGLTPGRKTLHNCRLPIEIAAFGKVIEDETIVFNHYGWNTLRRRMEKVDLYTKIDPSYSLNDGVPYDKGLLFGYRRDQIDLLLDEYTSRSIN